MKLFSFFKQELAIDLGTANTLIIQDGKVIVDEPSIVAINRQTGATIAVGTKAMQMHEKTHENIKTIRPLKDGVIADFQAAENMIQGMIAMMGNRRRFFSHLKMVICIPSGITEVEKRAVFDSADHVDSKETYLIHEPMAAALGIGLDVEEPVGNMIIDIGGGTTEIAVIALSGIVCDQSIRIAGDELTSDIPQFKSDKTGKELDFYNWRSRGFLSRIDGRPVVLFSEEDVLEYEGGMQLESILIHEFGHVIHRPGFSEELDEQLMQTWKAAMEAGLWNDGYASQRFRRVRGDEPVLLLHALKESFPRHPIGLLRRCLDHGDILVNGAPSHSGVKVTGADKVRIVFGGPKPCYATKNRGEYFAEIVQAWFDTNRTMDHDHNHIDTRGELKAYDPGAYAFLKKIFNEDNEWRFVSPRQRAGTGHLAGYDPSSAPVVVQPDFIKVAANDYYDGYWASYWERLYLKHGLSPE